MSIMSYEKYDIEADKSGIDYSDPKSIKNYNAAVRATYD